jgi:hypothetical protein
MLVVNAAALAALRRVFRGTRVRRHGSELTVTVPVDGDAALTGERPGAILDRGRSGR